MALKPKKLSPRTGLSALLSMNDVRTYEDIGNSCPILGDLMDFL